nr:DUF433 domain-containing protein [Haladaptatus litoreus]
MDVAGAYEHRGYSPDEIIDFYPALTLEDVYTAIAYYTSSDEFAE